MAQFVETLGATLLAEGKTKEFKEVKTEEVLKGKKAVALYFSAHWCPPCRGFTPRLWEWYEADLQKKGLEIVFISSDNSKKEFDDYFAEQPWLSLPYEGKEVEEIKKKLSKKFRVQGIPSLVILDGETGELITLDGRSAVSQDPTGWEMPWRPVPLNKLLLDTPLRIKDKNGENEVKEGKKLDAEFLKGKEALALYFSAHWCPPCQMFTPIFAECYKKVNKEEHKFAAVFVSCDRDNEQFEEYYGTMPWATIPFDTEGRALSQKISQAFDVDGIPALVMLKIINKDDGSIDFEISNKNAVGKVGSDAEGANFPWLPELVKEIDQDPEGIDEGMSLVVLMENVEEDAKKTEVKEMVKGIAAKTKKCGDDPLNFFCASKKGRLAGRVRDECGAGDANVAGKVDVFMMNIMEEEYYAWDEEKLGKDVTEDSIYKFFELISGGGLNPKPMGA